MRLGLGGCAAFIHVLEPLGVSRAVNLLAVGPRGWSRGTAELEQPEVHLVVVVAPASDPKLLVDMTTRCLLPLWFEVAIVRLIL